MIRSQKSLISAHAKYSSLLKRLQTEVRMYALYAALLPLGGGPFHLSKLDPDELADTLNYLTQTKPQVFQTPRSVTHMLDELNREIEETRTQYPGVEHRTCFLDETYDEIYERLSVRLTADGEENLLPKLPILFSGDQSAMTPRELESSEACLGVVSAALVHQAASVLEFLPQEELFDPEAEEWLAEDYGSWRTVYLEAAVRDEAIVIG